jgi:hypothetical protein
VLGTISVLVPRFPRLKEWAYAGTVLDLTGAMASHLAAGMPQSSCRTAAVYRLYARVVVVAAGEPPS